MRLSARVKKDVTVVMPCLNEVKTVGLCVKQALEYMKKNGLNGEVIVVDNGSTDGSAEEASANGAKVIKESRRGYGAAIRKGLKMSSGRVVIIGDCDTTYDFSQLDGYYYLIADSGYDMVIGNRFANPMEKGAMPLSHRIGVNILSLFGRIAFKTDIHDFHCGLRSISRDALKRLSFKTCGMEFATEMIAEASKANLKTVQIPITLSKCRFERKSKLKTVRDGLRHLGYILHKGRI